MFRRASSHAFRADHEENDVHSPSELLLSQTTLSSFLGVDKRKGLSKLAERLLDGLLYIFVMFPILTFIVKMSTLGK